MINSIQGTVKAKSATNVVIDIGGISLEITISVPTVDRVVPFWDYLTCFVKV